MKFIVIDKDNKEAISFDNSVRNSKHAFVRFHSPGCGWCSKMHPEMMKLKNHNKIDNHDVSVIDIDSYHTDKIKHPIGKKQHGQGVPAMYLLKVNDRDVMEEYQGDRTADSMANYISEKIGGYNKMKGGKKGKKHTGGYGGKDCDMGDDYCMDKRGGPCISTMDLQEKGLSASELAEQYEVCKPEKESSAVEVEQEPASPPAQESIETSNEQPTANFGTYKDIIREPDEYDDGIGDVPCKTQCGDHLPGHGLFNLVGLGNITHSTCEGQDGKQHKCSKPKVGGKKRKTRKHKKKAKKVHKKKTLKRKPKKTRKHKKKSKKQRKPRRKSYKKRR